MTTLERPHETIPTRTATTSRSQRSWIIVAVIAVLALVLGGVLGYVIRGGDTNADMVIAGGDQMTDRQEQMIEFLDTYEAAWQANDAAQVTASFVPTGTFGALGSEQLRVDDGSLADYVENSSFSSLDVLRPALVRDNEMVTFHRFGGRTYVEVLTFTPSGDLLLVSHDVLG
jgi:hypothetical protein